MLDSAEFQLLLACCANCFAGTTPRPLPIPQHLDWSEFLRLTRRHRVQGLCVKALSRETAELPPAIWKEFAADSRAIVEQNLRGLALARQLSGRFASAGIPLIFLKGHCLGQLAYADPLIKYNADVDILVPSDELGAAAKLLAEAGFRPDSPPDDEQLLRWHRASKESVWISPQCVTIDLHTRVADDPLVLRTMDARSAVEHVGVGPGFLLPTLKRDALLVYLAVHGASSAWFRLKWLSDFAALLVNCSETEIEIACQTSAKLGARRAFGLAVLLSHTLFRTRLSSSLKRELHRERAIRLLERIALHQLAASFEPTQRRFGTVGIHAAPLLLQSGLVFPLRDLSRQVRTAAALRSIKRKMSSGSGARTCVDQ